MSFTPENVSARKSFLLGQHYYNRWNEEGAIEAERLFKEVLERAPDHLPTYHWLTKTYIFQAGRGFLDPLIAYDKADRINALLLSKDPGSGEGLIDKGLLDFFYRLDWDSSYETIKKGLDRYDDKSEAYQQLSLFWYGMKQYDMSRAALEAALEFDPLATSLLNMSGDLYISMQQYDLAEKTFQAILKLKPNDATTLENLGYVSTLKGDKNRALHYFNRLKVQLPSNEPIVPRMGYAYGKFRMEKEIGELQQWYQQLKRAKPTKIYFNPLANLHAGMEDWDEVLKLITLGWSRRTGILFILTDPILEPIRKSEAYLRLVNEIVYPQNADHVSFQEIENENGTKVRINLEAILFLSVNDNYTTLHLYQNFRMEQVMIRQTMKSILTKLPGHFKKVHRKYAINSSLSYEMVGNSRGIVLTSRKYGFSVPVSRRYVSEVR